MKSKKNFLPFWLFLFFASFYALFSIGHFGGDGYEDYLTAESIVLDRNLSLYDRPFDKDELNYRQNVGIKGRDGKIYSSRSGLGMPLILSAFYYIGHLVSKLFKNIPHDFITMFFVAFANPLITALNCLFIFVIAKNIRFFVKTSLLLSFIYAFSTVSSVYARTGFSEPALGLFVLFSIYLGIKYKQSKYKTYLFLCALTIAYTVFIKPIAAIFIPAFTFYIMWIIKEQNGSFTERIKDNLIFVLPLLAFLFFIGICNRYIYGGFSQFGGHEAVHIGKRIFAATHFFKGLYYYLFSTGKSFFLFNLPLILSFIGLIGLRQERRKEAVLFVLIFIINLLFFAKSFRRGSLFSWGPRYLFPSISVLIFLAGEFYENYKNFLSRLSIWVLSLAGFFVMLPCMFVNQSKFYFFVKEELQLDEYLVNFVPDLSPIFGAWQMFISRLTYKFWNTVLPFIYNPDYKLVTPITASMNKYNYFDFWFLKIINLSPNFMLPTFILIGLMIICIFVSLIRIKSAINSSQSES